MNDVEFSASNIKKKVLVVEDKPEDQRLIASCIKKTNPNASINFSSSLLNSYKQYMKEDYNLVLLDLNLPDGLGPMSVKEVRGFNKNIPIIVITGLASKITIEEVKKHGATDLVLKSNLASPEFTVILERYIGKA